MNDDGNPIRELLLGHSDHRAVRAVFDAHTGEGTVETVDWIEAMRATSGDLALVAQDGAAEVYVRWEPSDSRFEHLSLWPPRTLVGYDRADRAGVESLLAGSANVRPVLHEETPFASPGALASLGSPLF